MHQAVAEFLKNKATQNKGKAWNRMLKRDLTHFALVRRQGHHPRQR